jgi:hypothetical protein
MESLAPAQNVMKGLLNKKTSGTPGTAWKTSATNIAQRNYGTDM